MTSFYSQQLPSEHENGEKMPLTRADFSLHFSGVESGLDFILGHFREPLFPRMISRSAIDRRQYEVQDKDTALYYYKSALYEDCRIAAFGVNQTNPDLLFIDIDSCDFATMRAFKLALTKTLNNIKDKLNGHPSILWSGRGFHVLQPIDCPVNLDEVKEFAALTDNPNNKFLQFAERYLSNGRCDNANHPALRSCMLRIPGSLNVKCKEAGEDAQVRILQRWNGFRPDYRLLLGHFHAYLVGVNSQKIRKSSHLIELTPGQDHGAIDWIERLLNTPIEDHRKSVRDLILIPYLIIRRGMTDENQICDIVMSWANRCSELRRLEPSRHEFESRIQSRIHEVVKTRIPPMRLETMKEKNPALYEKLMRGGEEDSC